jgi:energy-coupling factor transporter ATP-binding protein EcfA2
VLVALQIESKSDVQCGDMGGRSTLSGGQRKRVSVALELTMLPSVLFLDEATSGLDAETAFALMRVMKTDVAVPLNVAVVIVLHQPRTEIMEDCIDQVVMLQGGVVRYCGSTAVDAVQKLLPCIGDERNARCNIADVMIDEINHFLPVPALQPLSHFDKDGADVDVDIEHGKALRMHSMSSSSSSPTYERPAVSMRSVATATRQAVLFTVRAFCQSSRSVGALLTLYGLTAVATLFLGSMFRGAAYRGPPEHNDIAQCPANFYDKCALNQEDGYPSQVSSITLASVNHHFPCSCFQTLTLHYFVPHLYQVHSITLASVKSSLALHLLSNTHASRSLLSIIAYVPLLSNTDSCSASLRS